MSYLCSFLEYLSSMLKIGPKIPWYAVYLSTPFAVCVYLVGTSYKSHEIHSPTWKFKGLNFKHITNPKSKGIPSSACSGASNLENPVQKVGSRTCTCRCLDNIASGVCGIRVVASRMATLNLLAQSLTVIPS